MEALSSDARAAGSPERPAITLVVSDLDNTLYDWVSSFTASLYAMVAVASDILGVEEESILDELREVHRFYGNSEQPFALLETRTVEERFATLTRLELSTHFRRAFDAFNEMRRESLRLYPTVAETLGELKARGATLVAHTEATVPNALYRLRMLHVDRIFERLYALKPEGRGHPDPQRRPIEEEGLPPVAYIASSERKPQPRVLLDICRDMGVEPQRALYVGDSLARDIAMAREAGVWSAWAEYGTRHDPRDWERLMRVTHWSDEEITRSVEAGAQPQAVKPDVTLGVGLSDLLDQFRFERGTPLLKR